MLNTTGPGPSPPYLWEPLPWVLEGAVGLAGIYQPQLTPEETQVVCKSRFPKHL